MWFPRGTALVPIPCAPVFSPTLVFCACIISPKRRSAIEAAIGHMKNDGHLGRNCLKGREGDAANAILSAIGQNFRLILAWLRRLFAPMAGDDPGKLHNKIHRKMGFLTGDYLRPNALASRFDLVIFAVY